MTDPDMLRGTTPPTPGERSNPSATRIRPPAKAPFDLLQQLKQLKQLEEWVADLIEKNAETQRIYQERLMREDKWLADSRPALARDILDMRATPTISVLMPVYNPQLAHLREALDSVLDQLYPHWELCIADDASTDPQVRQMLGEYAARDTRIRVVYRPENGHISRATNSALALATGPFIALLDHDDRLHPLALYRIASAINANPQADLLYTDEDKIDTQGVRTDPYFKCDFNYELMLSHNMVSHLGVYRRSTAVDIGGFRAGFEGAQDYDFALRFIEAVGASRIRHLPEVLYHWRVHPQSVAGCADAKPYAFVAAAKAIAEHIARTGQAGEVLSAGGLGMYRVRFTVPPPQPSVDIVIPARDRADQMAVVLESLFEKTQYSNFRVIVADNGSVEDQTFALFERWQATGRVTTIRIDGPFNFSMLNNRAVKTSTADLVCLLNNDIEVIDGDWLTEMVSHALRPGVGCVGARLWYPDGRLQHGGIVLGIGGMAGHAHRMCRRQDPGYCGRAVLLQSFSAVTAACLVVRRSVYEEVGGLDGQLHAFNDVDFCLRVRAAGYRNVWTPYAELVHHESLRRGAETSPAEKQRFDAEIGLMKKRWAALLDADPMYSPNLSLEQEDFSFRR